MEWDGETYYFDPIGHNASEGWIKIYKYGAEEKKKIIQFKNDSKLF